MATLSGDFKDFLDVVPHKNAKEEEEVFLM
jgi:hypothetical protein